MSTTRSNSLSNHLRVGEVADACDVTSDTIRFYEQEGLIPEPPRFGSSGYRAYPPKVIKRVEFIQNAKDLGFSLDEISELLALRADDSASCARIREVAEQKATELREQIDELEQLAEGLESMTEICPGDVPSNECPFIDMLVE